ncbi:MAG: TonB-dependent receptor [Tannerellaceae bacterium]|nr:TonB-dependent receptor [Tannerellaceae bacterium]
MKFFNVFIFLTCVGFTYAQQITLSGTVQDTRTKEPIIGASILDIRTSHGTITDYDGNYTLEVTPESEIQVSYLGYETVTAQVSSRTILHFSLEESSTALNEVVVLGYGQESRKANLSVAASNKEINESVKSRATDMIGALQGQIAGVTISSTGGDPLAKPTVTIRGRGSRDSEEPLYVVDGVSGAPFNMEDVESITVLKDAASAAIYGTNVGSGGVILITTRKAKAGKATVTARANFGIQSAWRTPEMLNAEEYVKVRTDAANVSGVSIPSGINPEIYPYGQVTRTNWIDEIFRTGFMQRYAVTVNGGSEDLKAYASAEYSKSEGTLLNTFVENFGGKLNVDLKLNSRLTLSERLNYKYQNGQGDLNTSSHTGVTASAMFMPPSATVYEMDQSGNYVLDANGNRQFGGTVPLWAKDLGVAGTFGEVSNPVAYLKRLNQYRPEQTLFSTTSLALDVWEGLKLHSDFSASTENKRYEDFVSKVTEIGKTNEENSRKLRYSRKNTWLWETVASFDRTFDKHLISAMAGYSMSYEGYNALEVQVYDFSDESTYSQHLVNSGDWTKTKPAETKTQLSQVSAYARAAYSYDDRYILTASIRRDASSKLFKDNNSGIFPAVSGAWKISSEEFFHPGTVSLLKVRASWGQIGNVNVVNNYSYASNLEETGQYIYLGNSHETPIKGVGLTTIPNRNLIWETSEQTDLGFDLELLRGTVYFSADYYIKNTKDLIEEIPMPSVAGVRTDPYGNIGKVQNRGWEFTLGYNNRTRGGFEYQIDGNIAFLKSEVKDLGDREFFAHDKTIRAMQPLRSGVGQPWYSYYLIRTDGIFQSQAEIDAYTDANGNKIQPNAQPGDLKFVDANGDGIISDDDRQFMGSYTPKVTYGINGSFAYKNFDLSFSIQGVAGNKIFNGMKVMTYAAGQGWNMSKDVLDAWNYNKNSDIPLISMSDSNGNFSTVSDFFLENGSYARLKNLTLGYTFPKTLFGNPASAPLLRAYLTGENLFTITNYSGMDPEVGNEGVDGGRYPVSRVFSVGVNLTF